MKRTSAGSFIALGLSRVLQRGAKLIDPRDPNTIQHDFEQDVLERLTKMGANALGVPVVGVKVFGDGAVKVMCEGFGSDGRWRKFSVRATPQCLDGFKAFCEPQATAEIVHQLLGSTTNELAQQPGLAT